MPTVLDSLRRHLLGDEAADQLELFLDVVNARVFDGWKQKIPVKAEAASSIIDSPTLRPPAPGYERCLMKFFSCREHKSPVQANAARFIDPATLSEPSPGYEPLLIKMGFDQFTARGLAKFAVRRGRQQSRESKVCVQVRKDIRFLARGSRRRDAIIRSAQRLYDAYENYRIVGDLLIHANVDDMEFMPLLKSVSTGDLSQIQQVFEMAAKAVPRLIAKRGPKISAASATYEFFLNDKLGIGGSPLPRNLDNRQGDYVDSLTEATRVEFKNSDFESRSAKRRIKQAIKKST